MSTLPFTRHAAARMAQRGIKMQDAELIALIGTEVQDGFLVRQKDYERTEQALKALLSRLRHVVGKRLVLADGSVVTGYHASKAHQRRLLRRARESEFYD